MLFLFFLLFFNYSIQSDISVLKTGLIDESFINPPVCPFNSHVVCNMHNLNFLCFCYISPTTPLTDSIRSCNEVFDIRFPSFNVMEFRISSKMFQDYNWTDFDKEVGLIFEDSTGSDFKNFLFLRKYCIGDDIVIQTLRLNDTVKKRKRNKISDIDVVQIRATMLDVRDFVKMNLLNYTLNNIRTSESLYPLKILKSKKLTNVCEKSNLPTPTICNAHSESRRCVCKFTQAEAYYGTDTVSCDRIFDIDEDTKNRISLYSTVVYKENYLRSPEAFDEMILSDLEAVMRLEPGSLVMLRKFCHDKKLHIQFAQLRNASRNPLFVPEDLVPNHWNFIDFTFKVPKLTNGILAHFQTKLPLFPITVEDNGPPFDATIFTRFYYSVFFSSDPQHYFILLSPLICLLVVIFFVKRHLDFQEEEFERLFPRPKKRKPKLNSNGITKPLLKNHYPN